MGIACILAAVLHLVASDAGPMVTLQTLDGKLLAGHLESWSKERLVLRTEGDLQDITLQDLYSLRVESAGAQEPVPGFVVDLVDGSRLPVREFLASAQEATLELARQLQSEPRELRIAIDHIRSVQLRPLASAALAQWNDIEDLKLPSDVLVLQKRQDGGLDHVEGIIGNVNTTHVEFWLDEEAISVKRAKLAGLSFYRHEQPAGEPRSVVHGHGDACLIQALGIEALEKGLLILAAGDVSLQLPWNSVDWIDFSAGKIAYLSDLKPLLSIWTPLIELPNSAQLVRQFGEPRKNESFFGGPITLRESQPERGRFAYHEHVYRKGLAVRSRTELVYSIPTGFRRFMAEIGIEPRVSSQGNVDLLIEGDERVLLETALSGQDMPLRVELDVAEVRHLRLLVDYGDNLDIGDVVNFGNARFLK